MPRALSLKKETLAEITPHELSGVVGGAQTPNCPTVSIVCRIPTDHCASVFDCVNPSMYMDPCVTY